MTIRILIFVAAILALTISIPAQAGKTYVWTDDQGVTHFTDTPPPAKVRQKTKVKAKNVDAAPSEMQASEPGETSIVDVPRQAEQDDDAPLACGRGEVQWKHDYSRIDGRRMEGERRLNDKKSYCDKWVRIEGDYRKALGNSSMTEKELKMLPVPAAACRPYLMEQLDYAGLQREYEKLEYKAADCAVPLDWRISIHWRELENRDQINVR